MDTHSSSSTSACRQTEHADEYSAGSRTASHAGEMALATSTDLQAALIARPSAPEAMLTSRMISQNLKKAAAVGRRPACKEAQGPLCLGGE